MKYEVVAQLQDGQGDTFRTVKVDSDDVEIPEKGDVVRESRTEVDEWQVIRVTLLEDQDEDGDVDEEDETANTNYDEWTNAELHDEIVRRNDESGASVGDDNYIAASGTNDELASRLAEDDETD